MKSARPNNPSRMLKTLALAALFLTALPAFISVTRAETYTTSYSYDLNGNIETRTTPDNATINYTYDALNQLESITYPDGKTVTYTYDPDGNPATMTDQHGTTVYVYDRFNRLAAVQYPGINPIYYDYDKSGNLTEITYPDGTTVSYEYDTSSRLWKVTDETGTTVYEYSDQSNNLIKKTLPNGLYTSYTYDTAKRITDVVNRKSDGSLIADYHYEFDPNGNRTTAAETTPAGSKTWMYTYDKLNRLTHAACSDGAFETYTYDSSGNRMTKTTQDGTITYEYDGDNRLVRTGTVGGNTIFFYDRSGNLTRKISPTQTGTYTYDYENRLIGYEDGTNTVTFAYDGNGHRISKTVNGATTKYINDTSSPISQVLMETNNQDMVTARYSYGDSRLNQMNHGLTSYYVYDNPGRSVVAVVNDGQEVLNTYDYNPFGDIRTENETVLNGFKYTGEQYDEETGLIYLRRRYYDPETGRFLSKDPFPGFVTDPQTVNPYPYVQNNPVNFIDPLGLKPGDLFPTMDAAAHDAVNYINPTSIKEGKEYGGYIDKTQGGMYTYGQPTKGTKDGIPNMPSSGTDSVAWYHTHGAPDPGYNNENFSGAKGDKGYSNYYGIPGYLGTPGGSFKKYDPATIKETQLGDCSTQ